VFFESLVVVKGDEERDKSCTWMSERDFHLNLPSARPGF